MRGSPFGIQSRSRRSRGVWPRGGSEKALFEEAAFAQILRVERRRSDRSGNPFALLLVDVGLVRDRRGRPDLALINRVVDSLEVCTRQTDITGWYQNPTCLGVILTEINLDNGCFPNIVDKVRNTIRADLPQDRADQVAISSHCYPDGSVSEGSSKDDHSDHGSNGTGEPRDDHAWPDRELYPDLRRRPTAAFMKKAIDVVGSGALIIVLSPVFLLVAAAVKLTSRGPILFKQRRVGQFGRKFTVLKFRSMHSKCEPTAHQRYVQQFIEGQKNGAIQEQGLYKMRKDPRVTRLGRILRKTSLDELPQLFNVFWGDMSLVGPRPPLPYEVRCYDTWHRRRVLEAKPGITGLWQVYARSQTTFDEMVRLDLRYVDQWSLWSDIRILLRTPWVVLTCKGAC